MRVVLLILILAAIALILLIQSGFLSVSQTREARLPDVAANGADVTGAGGGNPSFQIERGAKASGSHPKKGEKTVPTIKLVPANQREEGASATDSATGR